MTGEEKELNYEDAKDINADLTTISINDYLKLIEDAKGKIYVLKEIKKLYKNKDLMKELIERMHF